MAIEDPTGKQSSWMVHAGIFVCKLHWSGGASEGAGPAAYMANSEAIVRQCLQFSLPIKRLPFGKPEARA